MSFISEQERRTPWAFREDVWPTSRRFAGGHCNTSAKELSHRTSEAVKEEFTQQAKEEGEHLDLLTERITQLGGKPHLNPDMVSSRAASEYVEGANLVDMIKENLVAERIAIETHREMVRYFGDKDSTSRELLERILAQEEEHANDMHDLLVSHEGRPMLEKEAACGGRRARGHREASVSLLEGARSTEGIPRGGPCRAEGELANSRDVMPSLFAIELGPRWRDHQPT